MIAPRDSTAETMLKALAFTTCALTSASELDVDSQTHIVIGDAVLDRGVRDGKQRTKQELKKIDPDAVDHVFPADIGDIVDAERHVEPDLVLRLTGRFDQAPDFPSKTTIKEDLEVVRFPLRARKADARSLQAGEGVRARVLPRRRPEALRQEAA